MYTGNSDVCTANSDVCTGSSGVCIASPFMYIFNNNYTYY